MSIPSPPADEAARVASLQSFDILDTGPEAAFDELAEVAARVCETPTGLVTLIDAKRQWFKARYGFKASETDRAIAFCAHTIMKREVLEIEDATRDPRFNSNPLVTQDPHIRFYAGAPIVTTDGYALGSLAVIDYKPRKLTDGQRATLIALSHQVVAQLELRRHLADLERKTAAALDRRDRRMSALLETSLDAIIFMDHRGRIIQANPAAEQTFGFTRDQAIGQDMADLIIPPRLREAHRRGLAARVESGTARIANRRVEMTAQRIDGRELPVELTITELGIEDPPVFAGSLRDVTDQREAESKLRQSIERFELAARATHDVIYDWDLRTNALWWSETLAANYGHEPAKLSAGIESWLELVHPEDRQRIEKSISAEIERRGAYWTNEYRFRRSDGSYAQVLDRGYITYDAGGQPARMIGALADMTERRRLEEQLIRSQKMEAIGHFASGIAHDFNNLLTVIECNSFFLADGVSEERAGCVKDILYATERAAGLTRQLLLLGRKQRLREADVDLNTLVVDMMSMLERMLTARTRVVSSIAPSVPPIRADASMLEQVLLNLVINARDAMEHGGTITISTAPITVTARGTRHGLLATPGLYSSLSVQDTGTGIAPETLPHIFEPFFTTKEIGRGTGLGLSTVYHIIKQHRGWLDVTSEIGRGSTFVIALPAVTDTQPKEPAPEPTQDVPRGTERILLVEDEPVLRSRMAQLLRQYGYEVLDAASGPAALELWRKHGGRVDLVLTDIVMPGGLDGRELARQLRRGRADLRVIYVSGFSPEHAGQGEELVDGVNFLEKPYAPQKLLQLIRTQLDAHRA